MKRTVYTSMALLMSLLVSATPTLAEGNFVSGQVSRADWIDRLPVIIVATILTLAVNAAFILPALRNLRADRQYQTGG